MHFVLERAIRQFERINEADKLTGADKQQLKNAYLQNYFEPETRELLKAKLANETRSASHGAGRRPWRRSKTAS
jgi:hypothetical protein